MKEVIFHFFPSARFLGLSLKILFHKNKEIKRMLSKKMTFSLMSLITILALAFTVTPVMAQGKGEFSVTIDGPTAVTYTLNTEGRAAMADVTVDLILTAGQLIPNLMGVVPAPTPPVDTNHVTVTVFDKDGNVIGVTGSPNSIMDVVVAEYPMRTGKMRKLRLTLALGNFGSSATTKVAKAIVTVKALTSTDPSIALTPAATKANANKSLAVYHTITISEGLPLNDSRPQVVSIQRLRPGSPNGRSGVPRSRSDGCV